MKTKQVKDDSNKTEDDSLSEPKTRARKKASDANEEAKSTTEEAKPTVTKRAPARARVVAKKGPLGVRKTLRTKKVTATKDQQKKVVKQATKRGRKPVIKTEPVEDNEPIPEEESLISPSEIKKEPGEDIAQSSQSSRSSSPKTAGRRQRLSSDMIMMKSVLSDTPSTLVVGSRTSPYSTRSERSNSPSISDNVSPRRGKPRKINNLRNEVVIKEQNKRRRLPSESKSPDSPESSNKRAKRGRSCSRDGSEISKCSDYTESDISLSEPLAGDSDNKELKKLDKPKTDLDIDNVQISSNEQVPFETNIPTENSTDDPSTLFKNKPMSLKRSTSLDSDNNNSNRIKLETFNSLDIDDKASLLMKTGNDTLSTERSSILTSMFKTFNSKQVAKNIRKARKGKKVPSTKTSTSPGKSPVNSANAQEDKMETLETLSNEINDLITNLDQNMDEENQTLNESTDTSVSSPVNKPFGLPKPLTDSNSLTSPDIVKDKAGTEDVSLQSLDDSENIKLHFEDDTEHPAEEPKQEIPFKITPVASIDKLMDRLKEFEELDKRRQRQESESKNDVPVMVTNDVVLIPKSGDIKMLKDHKNLSETMKSPERPVEKENVLSCFENNSAISIVKRDHIRKSVDVDFSSCNSVSLIKRNSIPRKESTGSNNSRESSDAISIFEKSFGRDVTLTEIRKSIDKPVPPAVNLLQLATLHPNKPGVPAVVIEPKAVSITPRVLAETKSNCTITKRKSRDSLSRKSSESGTETDDKMAVLEKIISPVTVKAITVVPLPVAVKSPEIQPMESEPQAPPIDIVKAVPDDLPTAETKDTIIDEQKDTPLEDVKSEPNINEDIVKIEDKDVEMKVQTEIKDETESKISESADVPKSKSPNKASKSARNSIENEAGPSNVLQETPESQKHKESVLRTLGLLTHKAAKEAKIEKAKEKERIYGMASKKAKTGEYTGTLKTVIKLNRNTGERDKKKHRSSLKMTFQKSKVRSGKQVDAGETVQDEYYTVERKEITGVASDGAHRKSHYSNRVNHDGESEPAAEVKEPTLNLVIPEKASSFSIHPGRLCMDQCFYCGGKFGLFDTPCHIAQMKSADRQKKVLDNEEKLTIDSCLCDACYRHVDRRANCPSYRKRPGLKQTTFQDGTNGNQLANNANATTQQPSKPPPLSPPLEEESSSSGTERTVLGTCHVEGCTVSGDRYIRRKWLIKMRQSVNQVLRLRYDYPGLQTIPLCSDHYRLLSPLTACNLCRRSLLKHHNVHIIHHGYSELNPLLSAAGVPVQFTSRPVLCKMCRYYCTLLQKPGTQDQIQHATSYRKRLLQLYNIEVPAEPEQQTEETPNTEDTQHNKQKKRSKTKHKQRKSAETDKQDDTEQLSESPHSEKKEESNDSTKNQNIEEDIESLISSNKILIPVTTKEQELQEETQFMDKQTELQYLLQKQNNPAQFLKTNLTQKKNMIKIGGVNKAGLQQRINDKNAKRIQKLGQIVISKDRKEAEMGAIENITCIQTMEVDKTNDVLKTLSEECTIETLPNKKTADINMLKNKWQMSESFSQVKKNLSELSKKLTIDKPGKSSEAKYSNPVKRLETNPSISVRELFPGEEEMNLQCNIEFNTVKGVTPEGWEKCSSTIQYDTETKKLWNDLQKPYGNQSSFLRHLVLLERYFRNGDLVLSPNANTNAATYSDSVQNRLKAFDNIPSDKPTQVSLIDFRKKPTNSKSLLKTNQPIDKDKRPAMPPPGIFPKPKPKDKPKSKPLPPELIAINTPNSQGRKSIQNVLHNIQQLVKGVSASDPVEVASSPIPVTSPTPMASTSTAMKVDTPKEVPETIKKDASKKQKNSSKPWRPTLMPITPENLAKIAREPPQVAVDGRSLPSLVQVKASGQRYHITIQDYNKMCIMRREKLQQLHDGEKAKRPSIEEAAVITEIQPSVALGNGGTMRQMSTEKDDKSEITTQIGNAATILKNVGLKNITIAPIPAKTSTVTSLTLPSPIVSSPSLLVASAPIKIPQLGSAVSITSEAVLTPNYTPITSMANLIMPKIPKSLTVIPQVGNSMGMATLTSMSALNSMQAMAMNNVVVTPSDSNRL